MLDNIDLSDEAAIVWLEPPDRFPYVRESIDLCAFRERRPRRRDVGRLIGYATLKPEARSQAGYFHRRVFWVKDYDRSEQPDGVYRTGAPAEAVSPGTVGPGRAAKLTETAWRGA